MKKFGRILKFGYGFSVIMLMVVGAMAYLTLRSVMAGNRQVSESGLVVQQLEKLLFVMKDAETGQRGYLLTGHSQYLEPYRRSYSQALVLVHQLDSLTASHPAQQKNIAEIRRVLAERLDILQKLIDQKRQGQVINAVDLDAGKLAMDALRRAVDRAESSEQQQLSERKAALQDYARWAPALILAAIVLAILIAIYSYVRVAADFREKDLLYRELREHQEETAAVNEEMAAANEEITAANEELTSINKELSEARTELQSANETLEQRVAERTRALQHSEEETQALNEELSAMNEELASANEELAASNEELQTTNEELAESERRLQELVDELRLAEERSAKLAAIVESSDDAIIGKTLEGIVTSWNQAAVRMYGYTESEMLGSSILKTIPEDRQYEEPEIIATIKAGKRVYHYETKRLTRDGRLIDVSLTISPILDKTGQIIGISKIARDISEQKQNEQRKNDFIGMASHELKTPLTSLAALIQVLQQKLGGSPDAFVPSALSKANLQTKKMTSLINGFLNVSRLESGKLLVDKQPMDLCSVIREEIDEIKLIVNSHTFLFEPAAPVMVSADRQKISSVISNLLSNAVKYSPRGKMVTIQCREQDGEALVSVQDKGMGVKPQDLPRLFERYFRASSEHTQHISGFGVGLYLSAEIIKRHGGRIWAESEKGVGSIFYFTLPLN